MSDPQRGDGDTALGLAADGLNFLGLIIIAVVVLVVLAWAATGLGLIHEDDPCASAETWTEVACAPAYD